MNWFSRHVIACVLVFSAVAVTGSTFAFARPTYHAASPDKTVHMTSEHHYVLSQVRSVFAKQGFHLGRMIRLGDAKHGAVVLGITPSRRTTSAFSVTVYGPEAVVHFGAESDEARLGNVAVNPGQHDDHGLLARVKAAMADLR